MKIWQMKDKIWVHQIWSSKLFKYSIPFSQEEQMIYIVQLP